MLLIRNNKVDETILINKYNLTKKQMEKLYPIISGREVATKVNRHYCFGGLGKNCRLCKNKISQETLDFNRSIMLK